MKKNYFKHLKHKIKIFFKVHYLLISGVKINKPSTIQVLGEISTGSDIEIENNVTFRGKVVLSDGVHIGNNCELEDCSIGSGTSILANSLLNGCNIESDSSIGPYARIRPFSNIGSSAQIGNFVEIKNSSIGDKCRINHMAFIGDASIGSNVTIGAGTITCNHDGAEINKTTIEDGAYIGSNVNLVAPITIYSNATIGSGSTITQDAPEEKLTLARMKQSTIENWKGPKSTRK